MRVEFQTDMNFYGFIGAELVQWYLTEKGHLAITTLDNRQVYIGRGSWHHKRSFFGPGKIEFNLAYKGTVYPLSLRIPPLRERSANEADFLAGRNGPLNLPTRTFTSVFPDSWVLDPDKVLSEITDQIP